MDYSVIEKADPELARAIVAEQERQQYTLELIASENIVSPAVMAAQGSLLTNKYAEGYPKKRYYGGCEHVDEAESLAIERAKKLFGAPYANVQAHSGSQANMGAYFALIEPGDKVLGMNLAHGGHLTHGSKISFSGMLYKFISYGVEKETGLIDYDNLRKIALEEKPKLIVAGASSYPRTLDFTRFSQIAKEAGAFLMVDMAHIAGLVAGGVHPSPVGLADITTSTTHKTLRGPRGGLILANEEYGKKIDKQIFPGIQGGPLMHVIAAKAVAFQEALSEKFAVYQRQVVANARALAQGLMDQGAVLVSGGTDNHMMLMDLQEMGITGKTAQTVLEDAGITTNKNAIPFDPQPPTKTSGIRIGTPALTTRGMKEDQMQRIAGWIMQVLSSPDDAWEKAAIKKQVRDLCDTFPLPFNTT